MLIASLTELYRRDTSSSSKTVSFCLALVVLACLVLWIISAIVLNIFARHSVTKSIITSRWFRQCFSDTKDLCLPRSMTILFFMRRLLLCVVVTLLRFLGFKTKLIIFVSIQACYTLTVAAIRPFEKIKSLLLEHLNEAFYVVLICMLFKFNTESDWTDLITQTYVWIMISNNSIILVITLCKFPNIIILQLDRFCPEYLKVI